MGWFWRSIRSDEGAKIMSFIDACAPQQEAIDQQCEEMFTFPSFDAFWRYYKIGPYFNKPEIEDGGPHD